VAPSINEQLADRAAEHALNLLRYAAGERERLTAYLIRLELQLDEMLRLQVDTSGSAAIKRQRIETLLAQVRATIRDSYGEIATAHEEGLARLASASGSGAVSSLRPVAIAAEIELNVLSASQLRALATNVLIEGAPSREWWSRQAGDLLERFSDEIRKGYALGESIDDMVRRVRGRSTGVRHTYELGGRRYTYVEFEGGILDTATRNAEALVRTSVSTISAEARRATYRENQDVVKGVVQVSTLDTRTTAICIARAGRAWAYPDMEPIDHDIAYGAGAGSLHWNCRSVDAPLLRSWKELGIDLDDAGAGRRWSRLDGKVPGDFTFDEFLTRRSPAQIEQQLGKRAADLYRDGKLGLEDLIHHATNRPLTVAELEAIAGRAA
jgi:hypothetical protein